MTAENLSKIQTGMTPDQVQTILGQPTETHSQGAVGLTSTTFVYKKGESEAKIVFLNDRVMATTGELK